MTPIDAASRPRLARGVRLRLDRITGKTLLIRPEQGFELQGSAIEIVKLCTAEFNVHAIVDKLAAAHDGHARQQIADDVQRLLSELGRRGLVELVTP